MTPTASTHDAEVHDHAAVGAPDQPAPPADVAGARGAHRERPGRAPPWPRPCAPRPKPIRVAKPRSPNATQSTTVQHADPDRDGQALPQHARR